MGNGMEVFAHDLYEYIKGVRPLALLTTDKDNQASIEDKLNRDGIAFETHTISDVTVNVYFGDNLCVEVVRKMNKPNLRDLTPEEDFILGTMLGYSVTEQCKRYLNRTKIKSSNR